MPETTDPAMAEMREAYGCSEYELWFQGHDRKIVKIGLTVDQVIEAVRHGIDVRPCGGVHLDSATLDEPSVINDWSGTRPPIVRPAGSRIAAERGAAR